MSFSINTKHLFYMLYNIHPKSSWKRLFDDIQEKKNVKIKTLTPDSFEESYLGYYYF